jgi:hypothetical protein
MVTCTSTSQPECSKPTGVEHSVRGFEVPGLSRDSLHEACPAGKGLHCLPWMGGRGSCYNVPSLFSQPVLAGGKFGALPVAMRADAEGTSCARFTKVHGLRLDC